ncbi:uncharacterized protein EI90DRAFT_3011373 [Cantharellus anzutake]|uniref:uncharacterized protein n=1 Tax=Cantharellus anzutake TaxID=1750568 RepID=UPI001907B137|nr:uncharacterized protein EI90DRAFT_3011373 [Cantharellus anzutake]KAF8342949.1 hypothetical protein EI90DRAFT_3011373 [Cantharellus anzutake]
MDPAILTRMLAHAQSENFLGNVQPTSLSYRSFDSANSQCLRGSWVSVNDRMTVSDVAFIGIITLAKMGHYGNQLAAPYAAWREQGRAKVNSTKYQLLLAPAAVREAFTDQMLGLIRLKNASGLGHHIEGGWSFTGQSESGVPHIHVFLQRAAPMDLATEIHMPNSNMRITLRFGLFEIGTPETCIFGGCPVARVCGLVLTKLRMK